MTALLSNWHLMRVLRAGLAVWAFYEIGRTGDWIFLLPGVLFAVQAIFDVGCCGAAGCAAPPQNMKQTNALSDEVTYEEVR